MFEGLTSVQIDEFYKKIRSPGDDKVKLMKDSPGGTSEKTHPNGAISSDQGLTRTEDTKALELKL